VAAKNYIWDSQAVKRLQESELTMHFTRNKKHYLGLAKMSWEGLTAVSDVPEYLMHDDLWDVLLPVISRDATTLQGLRDKELPEPAAYGGARWTAWFTHYVVDQFLATAERQALRGASDDR
jgi:hypothetical protein